MRSLLRFRESLRFVLFWGFGGTILAGACTGPVMPSASECPTPVVDPPLAEPATCPAPVEDPCMRYRIELVNKDNPQVRAKYCAAFGDACYLSVANTFDCFYQKWEKACEDAVKIGAVSGNAPYDPGYTCQPDGVGNYTLQIGPNASNVTHIYFENALRQTPLVEVDGVEVEVDGPYRNLPEPPTVGPGQPFNKCASGMFDADGKPLLQHTYLLQINRNANGGKIHSDLAGFTWPCEDKDCKPTTCTEPDFLDEPNPKADYLDAQAQVHHVVPMTDKRSCAWGTNSNKNAAVISRALNIYFRNHNPPKEEVKRLNNAPAYAP